MRFRKTIVAALAAVTLGSGAAVVAAPAQAAPGCIPNQNARIAPSATALALRDVCTPGQYARLFRTAEAGPLPIGVYRGQVRPVSGPNGAASAAAAAVWSGKTFHRGWLLNRAFGGEILPADVYYAPSAVDGKRVIRIDYRRSGIPFAHDELRRLPSGVYLGYGFLGANRAVDFWVWK